MSKKSTWMSMIAMFSSMLLLLLANVTELPDWADGLIYILHFFILLVLYDAANSQVNYFSLPGSEEDELLVKKYKISDILNKEDHQSEVLSQNLNLALDKLGQLEARLIQTDSRNKTLQTTVDKLMNELGSETTEVSKVVTEKSEQPSDESGQSVAVGEPESGKPSV